ncbi:MAG TPA: hypothetical protein VE870_10035 [Bacteroidales bacterium]|nr:hypothetical protein [Bacteroidales bacterium]
MRLTGALILLIWTTTIAYSQEWNSARLSLIYGSDIPFNFNSMQKYRDGIEILDGTILGISLADSSAAGHTLEGFDLNIRTFNGATFIRGDVNNLSLDRIRIKAENYLGLSTGFTYGYVDLSAVWTTLFSYTNPAFTGLSWDTDQISISYECGKPVSQGGNGSLLGEDPGPYTIELEIEIIPAGPGF